MGTEYAIACDETNEVFELGKGRWPWLDLTRCSLEALERRIEAVLPPDTEGAWRDALASRMYAWLERVGWRVYLVDDASDTPQRAWRYMLVGARYDSVQRRIDAAGGKLARS